eukprot:scaffold118587_cov17-Tisochrysis_lutea.AAC.1
MKENCIGSEIPVLIESMDNGLLTSAICIIHLLALHLNICGIESHLLESILFRAGTHRGNGAEGHDHEVAWAMFNHDIVCATVCRHWQSPQGGRTHSSKSSTSRRGILESWLSSHAPHSALSSRPSHSAYEAYS